MCRGLVGLNHISCLGLASNSALDGLFGCLIIPILNTLINICFMVDKYAHANKHVISFFDRNRAISNAIHDRHGNTTLCRTKHLNSLTTILDGNFVEHHGRWLCHQIRCNHCQKTINTFLLIGQSATKSVFRCATTWPHDQINMRHIEQIQTTAIRTVIYY